MAQSRQLLELLGHMQLGSSAASASASAPAAAAAAAAAAGGPGRDTAPTSARDQATTLADTPGGAVMGEVGAAAGGHSLVAVKPGFYEQQLAAAAAAAAAVGTSQQGQQPSSAQYARGGGGCCGGGHGHGHGTPSDALECDTAAAQEPTEAEYSAAIREALQQLDACVIAINEALQDVQDAVDNFEEGMLATSC